MLSGEKTVIVMTWIWQDSLLFVAYIVGIVFQLLELWILCRLSSDKEGE